MYKSCKKYNNWFSAQGICQDQNMCLCIIIIPSVGQALSDFAHTTAHLFVALLAQVLAQGHRATSTKMAVLNPTQVPVPIPSTLPLRSGALMRPLSHGCQNKR